TLTTAGSPWSPPWPWGADNLFRLQLSRGAGAAPAAPPGSWWRPGPRSRPWGRPGPDSGDPERFTRIPRPLPGAGRLTAHSRRRGSVRGCAAYPETGAVGSRLNPPGGDSRRPGARRSPPTAAAD